jgi:hypothetical protein
VQEHTSFEYDLSQAKDGREFGKAGCSSKASSSVRPPMMALSALSALFLTFSLSHAGL